MPFAYQLFAFSVQVRVKELLDGYLLFGAYNIDPKTIDQELDATRCLLRYNFHL